MTTSATGVAASLKRATSTTKQCTRTGPALVASSGQVGPFAPAFIHLYDLGLALIDTGRRVPSRQTLIRRGAEFAARNGITVHEVGRDKYVSTAEVERLHAGVAA